MATHHPQEANPELNLPGEVSGAFLWGLREAFSALHLLPGGSFGLYNVDPDQWYPYSRLIEAIRKIEAFASPPIVVRAAMLFMQSWYEHGPGKTMINSALDWLKANDTGGAYATVVRGGTPDEIGICRTLVQSLPYHPALPGSSYRYR